MPATEDDGSVAVKMCETAEGMLCATILSVVKLREACKQNPAIVAEVEAAIVPVEHSAAAYKRIQALQVRIAP